MKSLLSLFCMISLMLTLPNFVTGNNSEKTNSEKKTERSSKIDASTKVFHDVTPLIDKKTCDIKLDFDLNIQGLEVEFVDKSKGRYTDVELSFGDGENANAIDGTHIYNNPGTYYFTITLFDTETGCVDFFAANMYLNGNEKTVTYQKQDISSTEILNLNK